MNKYVKDLFYKAYAISPQRIINKFLYSSHNKAQLSEFTIQNGIAKGLKLYIDKESYLNIIDGSYENSIIGQLISRAEFPNCQVLDIGAHFGYISLCIAKHIGNNGEIFAFEQNPNNISIFKRHLVLNPDLSNKIRLVEYGISNEVKNVRFNISSSDSNSTTMGGYIEDVVPPLHESVYRNFNSIEIKTTTIDAFIESNKISPKIIKIDIEGAEYKALIGGMNYITKVKPVLFIEVHGVIQMFKVVTLLFELGYRIEVLNENELSNNCCNLIAFP